MNIQEIRNIRLYNQQLSEHGFKKPEELVSHFGAMQAQDYAMAKWAVGLRTGLNEESVEKAINEGEILRTHLLRPTWHFVAAKDIYWMLELTSPHIKTIHKSSSKRIGLDDKILDKAYTIIEELLVRENHSTRDEIMAEMHKQGIATDNNRSSHIMMHAELEGLVCSGATRGKKPTYALLGERVNKPTQYYTKEEALAKLARTYFTSHGPATLQDFIWWSGLSATNSRMALEGIKADMEEIKTELHSYWFYATETGRKSVVSLLPAFDEFLISYKDRTASIALELQHRAFTNNGIFNPVLLVDGKIEGSWKRIVKNEKVFLEIGTFMETGKETGPEIIRAAETYGRFLDKTVEIL